MPEDRNGKGWLASLPNDSVAKTLIVAIGLCLICSVVVSATAVALKPLQLRNAILARQIEILRVAGLMEEGGDVEVLFQQVEVRVVDLDRRSDLRPAQGRQGSVDERRRSTGR
jgi:Na+-transporting NADH:ubiquinone oxidoreductase subunit C